MYFRTLAFLALLASPLVTAAPKATRKRPAAAELTVAAALALGLVNVTLNPFAGEGAHATAGTTSAASSQQHSDNVASALALPGTDMQVFGAHLAAPTDASEDALPGGTCTVQFADSTQKYGSAEHAAARSSKANRTAGFPLERKIRRC